MKSPGFKLLLILAGAVVTATVAAAIIRGSSSQPLPVEDAPRASGSGPANETLADRQLKKGESLVKRAEANPEGYNLICAAYMQKARDTGDFSFNAKAENALDRSLAVAPDNVDGTKLKASLLLTYHRFGEALEVARRARQMSPRDHMIYGAMTDALIELGRYDESKAAIDEMLHLRPDSSGYARLSYYYSLHGKTEGAIESMRAAVNASTPQDAEGYAWYRVHLGDELMKARRLQEAEREFDQALDTLPGYHLALAAKGRARVAAGDYTGAVEYYKKSLERVPLPDTAIALGDLYSTLGRPDEAEKQYELVEFIEQSSAAQSATYSRPLALFWANHDKKLNEALDIARMERAARSDIYTCDALAWCLFKNGDLREAKAASVEALRLGTRDALIHYHAGMILYRLHESKSAAFHLTLALKINPAFDLLQAEVAGQTLEEIRSGRR